MSDGRFRSADARLGVALSGGGHRATLLGLGALLYIADAGKGADVHTIASVSAGSITNAYLGSLKQSPLTSGEAFAPHVAHLAHKIAGNRTWWMLSWTLVVVFALWLLMILFRAPMTSDWLTRVFVPIAALTAVAIAIGWRSGGSLWAWWGTWLWLVIVAVSLVPGVYMWRMAADGWARLGAAAVSMLVVGSAVFLRGHALRWSLSRTIAPLGSSGPNRAGLEDMNEHIEHVIGATELHAGTHAYFGRDFVYSREFGFGEPAGLTIGAALHASASFPLVFPVCILRAAKHAFRVPDVERRPRRLLVLSDGGIVDSMADAWQLEAAERAQRLSRLNCVQNDLRVSAFVDRLTTVPKTLIVIDASPPPVSKGAWAAVVPFITEMFGAARVSGMAYSSAVQTRARDLEARFAVHNPRGVLVASARSPMDVLTAILDHEDRDQLPADVITRANGARGYLAMHFPNENFAAFPSMTMASGTYLTPVGAERTAHILLHGYLQAMIALHVTLGYPLLATAPARDDFRRLVVRGVIAPQVARNFSAAVV
jgi:hypothetical protein